MIASPIQFFKFWRWQAGDVFVLERVYRMKAKNDAEGW